MKNIVKNLCSFVVISLVLSGCKWKETTQLDQVRWSEDGSEVLYAVLHYEEGSAGPGDGTTPKRNFRHELRVRDADGGHDRIVASPRPGQNGADIYRMKCLGYSLVPVVSESSYRVDMIKDGAGVETIDTISTLEHCQTLNVIPSPRGEYLAKVKTKGCASAGEAPVADFDVMIMKSSDLTVTAQYQFLGLPTHTGMAWNQDNQLVLSDDKSAKYLDTEQKGVVDVSTAYPCLIPATTSSDISASGLVVGIQNGQIQVLPASGGAQPFACGAHKEMDMSCKQ